MDRRRRPISRLNKRNPRGKSSSFWTKIFQGKESFSLFKKAVLIAGGILIILGPFYLWSSGYLHQKMTEKYQLLHQKFASFGFRIEDVMVEGRTLTSQKDILTVLNAGWGDSIFWLSLPELRQKLQELPWVRSATVQRRLPNVLYIRLAEHRPLAIWQNKSKMYLIDDRGKILENPEKTLPTDFLILTGEGAPEHAATLIEALETFPDIAQKVTGAIFISHRRWDIIVDHKLKLKLSETDLKGSLESFLKLMRDHKLDDKEIISIDLRFKDRAYFQLPPPPEAQKKVPLSKTIKENT